MKYLLKQIKYLVVLFVFLTVILYATLLPKPYFKDIGISEINHTKVFSGQLKIITFDAGLLDVRVIGKSMYRPTDFIDQRALAIPKQLITRDADVVALQEVYAEQHINYFIEQLKSTYPYYFFKHTSQIKLNNGLMIFSKYPFASTKGESEKSLIKKFFIADRGLISAVIELNDEISINVVNLHASSGGSLNATDSDSVNSIRQAQIEQALQVALSGNTEYQIIVGDINAGPNIADTNYRYLLEHGFTDAYAEYSSRTGIETKPTWHGANPLNEMRGYTKEDAQRIDHLYLSKNLTGRNAITRVERIFDNNIVNADNKSFPLSDHYGVELELSFK